MGIGSPIKEIKHSNMLSASWRNREAGDVLQSGPKA